MPMLLRQYRAAIFCGVYGAWFSQSMTLKTASSSAQGAADTASTDVLREQLERGYDHGSIHDVVGHDGILQVVLERDGSTMERAEYSTKKLLAAGIVPTWFAATDVSRASQDQLRQSCPLNSEPGTAEWCSANKKVGPGCLSDVEQAITDSHHRALKTALKRTNSDWTLIMEDDVVPVDPEAWDENFRQAWPKIPKDVKMVRLSRCTFESDLGPVKFRNTTVDAGDFQVVDWPYWTDNDAKQRYYTGGCTTGYMVHKAIIPELLHLFPCCCPIDCCLENQLFYSPAHGPGKEFRGEEVMTNLDHKNTRIFAAKFTSFNQSGVLVQDNRELRSSRPEWQDVRKVAKRAA